jgi:hypothetical protein
MHLLSIVAAALSGQQIAADNPSPRLRNAGADAALITALRGACTPARMTPPGTRVEDYAIPHLDEIATWSGLHFPRPLSPRSAVSLRRALVT